jgi:hypothetical protein
MLLQAQCPFAKFFKPAPEVPAFEISSAVLDASAQPFLPQINYLQVTIDFAFVQPVYLALNASSPVRLCEVIVSSFYDSFSAPWESLCRSLHQSTSCQYLLCCAAWV